MVVLGSHTPVRKFSGFSPITGGVGSVKRSSVPAVEVVSEGVMNSVAEEEDVPG